MQKGTVKLIDILTLKDAYVKFQTYIPRWYQDIYHEVITPAECEEYFTEMTQYPKKNTCHLVEYTSYNSQKIVRPQYVGYVYCDYDNSTKNLWICSLCIDSSWRRKGIASEVLTQIQKSHRWDYKTIGLGVKIENTQAQALYVTHGFTAMTWIYLYTGSFNVARDVTISKTMSALHGAYDISTCVDTQSMDITPHTQIALDHLTEFLESEYFSTVYPGIRRVKIYVSAKLTRKLDTSRYLLTDVRMMYTK